jgi:hypothetical protein
MYPDLIKIFRIILFEPFRIDGAKVTSNKIMMMINSHLNLVYPL